MEDVTDKVARQYTDYAYPQPATDLEAWAAGGGGDFGDPSIFGPMLFPEGRPHEDLDILVAGCGTQQAAMLAYRNRSSRVVGIDLSEASLGHQRFLRDKHGLTNLELFQGNLLEVGELGRGFDLIVSTGVLHHMPDPGAGLRALAGVLRPEGALCLMVYGAVGRAGVYLMQDAFRRMGLGQSAEDVATARAVIANLPPDHPVRAYMARADELQYDVALVDTFLHPQDRAYTVPELLDWAESSGVEFQSWMQNHLYYPQALILDPAFSRVAALPEPEQWAAVEALMAVLGIHVFTARLPGKAVRLDFGGPAGLAYRPTPLVWCKLGDAGPDGSAELKVNDIAFTLNRHEAVALRAADGKRTIAEIVALPAFTAFPQDQREAFGRAVFEKFWKIGAAMFEA